MRQLLSQKEVAELLGVHHTRVVQLRREGKLPWKKDQNGAVLIPRAAAVDYLSRKEEINALRMAAKRDPGADDAQREWRRRWDAEKRLAAEAEARAQREERDFRDRVVKSLEKIAAALAKRR